MPPRKFWLNPSYCEIISFEEFQDGNHGDHVGYQKGMILAILILHVAPMPPIKFLLNTTYGFKEAVVSRNSRWPP